MWDLGGLSSGLGLARSCLGPSTSSCHPARRTDPAAPQVQVQGSFLPAGKGATLTPLRIFWPPHQPLIESPLLLHTAQGLALRSFCRVWSEVLSPLACGFTADQSTHKEASRQAGVPSARHPGGTTVCRGTLKLREMKNLSKLGYSLLLF